MKKSFFIPLIFFFIVIKSSIAQYDDRPDKNLSPYFFIEKEGVSAEQFPLLSTKVQVNIVGPIADVMVEQTYKNNGSIPIEATYIFPASTRAAVYDLKMIIGERIIQAEIKEKNTARREYETAKSEGKRATLLEQQRTNVFQIYVANILPGDLIQVVMRFNEFIIPENQEYSFAYPTVVGPRFVSDKNHGTNESFAANPYLRDGAPSNSIFDIQVDLNLPVTLQSVASTTHSIYIQFIDSLKASARLSAEEHNGGNRDFILNYSMSGSETGSGTILYEHGDENFFLTTIEPPKLKSTHQVLPREFIFVVDVSGSMFGFPIETTKTLLKNLVSKLRPNDLFNVMLFAGGNTILSPASLPGNTENLQAAFQLIDQLQGSGTTEILPALQRIYSLPKSDAGLSRSIVIVTDGYVTVEPEVFELISQNLDQGNVFAFGIGSGVNRLLIEGMAHVGRGEAFIVTKESGASKEAERFRKYIESPVLSNIQFKFSGFEAYDIIPSVIPDLLAERPIYIFGKYRGEARGKLQISGIQSTGKYDQVVSINTSNMTDGHQAIRYLWAREKIRWHHDFSQLSSDQKRVDSITQLGLKYNLLTDFTSFVAVDESEIINPDGVSTRVKQVLPLPAGVSNYAVGFEMGAEGISPANVDLAFIRPIVTAKIPEDARQELTQFFSSHVNHWQAGKQRSEERRVGK